MSDGLDTTGMEAGFARARIILTGALRRNMVRVRQSVHPAVWSATDCSVGLPEWVTTTSVPASSGTRWTSTAVVSSSPRRAGE